MASDSWGVSTKVGTEDVLLGTQLWCTQGDPRDVTAVDWNEAEGLEVVDFVTLNQPAKVGRVGLVTGDIDTTQEIPQRSRVISTPYSYLPRLGPRHVRVIPLWYHFHMAMTLRLTPEDERLLAALAEAEGVSRHEATLRAIRDAAARRGHEAKVAELSARARDRYADVLERLGR